MAVDPRKKNVNWKLHTNADGTTPNMDAQLAVLMDIRDELQAMRTDLANVRSLANCYRIPRALDAMHELGVEARRKKRAAAKRAKKRKAA